MLCFTEGSSVRIFYSRCRDSLFSIVFPINPLSANTQRIKAISVPSSTTPYLNHCCPAGSPQSCRDCDLVNKWAMQSMGSIPCTSISFLFQTQSGLHGENLGSDVSSTPELTKNQRLNLIPMSQGLCCRFLSQVKRSTCNTVESHLLQGNITSLCVAAGLEGLEFMRNYCNYWCCWMDVFLHAVQSCILWEKENNSNLLQKPLKT